MPIREPDWTDQEFADAIAREAGQNVYVAINHKNPNVYIVPVADDPLEKDSNIDGFLIGLCENS